jgi:hypothetical protein
LFFCILSLPRSIHFLKLLIMAYLFRSFRAAALAGVMLLTACKKGDTGPQGPTGNANVIYSQWQMTNPWVASTSSTGTGKSTFYFDLAAPAVTQSVVDSGTVLVYAKFVSDPDGADVVKQLPSIYYNFGSATTQYRFQPGFMLNKVRVICDVIPSGSPSASNQVRYIIIPGGTAATLKMAAQDMSYKTVCARYHIPE